MAETYRQKGESRMKKIFREMDSSEVNIQTFYEQLEKNSVDIVHFLNLKHF